jgi:hypothetical protein
MEGRRFLGALVVGILPLCTGSQTKIDKILGEST